MDQAQKAHYRKLIKQEEEHQRGLVRDLEEWGLHATQTDAYGDGSAYDNHPGDGGSETFEREKDLGLKFEGVRRLEKLGYALKRLEQGTYGTCEVCGGAIDPERLEVMPDANLCIHCQREAEQLPDQFARPIEEKALYPPFGRTASNEDPRYDGGDAWQEVGSYGTSETPADVPGALDYNDLYYSSENQGWVQPVEALVDEKGDALENVEGMGADSPLTTAVREFDSVDALPEEPWPVTIKRNNRQGGDLDLEADELTPKEIRPDQQ